MRVNADRPPSLVERLLEAALAGSPYRHDIVGDLHEAYASVLERHSRLYARWWYRAHALGLAARYATRLRFAFKPGNAMDRLAMDVRDARRSLAKHPLVTAAIVLTLAVVLGANAGHLRRHRRARAAAVYAAGRRSHRDTGRNRADHVGQT